MSVEQLSNGHWRRRERLDAGDFEALKQIVLPPHIEPTDTRIPRDVVERTVTELCTARMR